MVGTRRSVPGHAAAASSPPRRGVAHPQDRTGTNLVLTADRLDVEANEDGGARKRTGHHAVIDDLWREDAPEPRSALLTAKQRQP